MDYQYSNDADFITIVRELATKLEKSGDKMLGNIDMNNYRIINIRDPERDSDCASKGYIDSITKTLHRNEQNDYKDLHLHIAEIQRDIVDIEKLCRIGENIAILLNKHNIIDDYNSLARCRNNFMISLTHSISMFSRYNSISEASAKHINEISHCTMFVDLTIHIIKIIENLSQDLFYEFRNDITIEIPDKGIRKRYRKFLIKLMEEREVISDKLRLLIDKNILLIDLGFSYFIPSLLDNLLQ